MPLSTQAIGHTLPESVSEITTRRALAYAAGIGDTGDLVFDDAASLVAPPQLCVSLEWPVVSHPEARGRLGGSADELRRGVHAIQDSVFHRSIRPGDRLATRGRILELRPTRAGALQVTRLDTSDLGSGEPVVTSWSTSIYRGVEVAAGSVESGQPAGQECGDFAPPLPEVEQSRTRETVETVGLDIPREMAHVYTECADIWNPIHTERAVALGAGLPDIILHGTATWALAGREAMRLFADGDPRRLRRLYGEFRGMVIPGTRIEIELGAGIRQEPSSTSEPDDRGDLVVAFLVRNHLGEPAIRNGIAVLSRS